MWIVTASRTVLAVVSLTKMLTAWVADCSGTLTSSGG